MMATTHRETGLLFWTGACIAVPAAVAAATAAGFPPPGALATLPLLVVLAGYPVVYAFADGPDIDHPGSSITRRAFGPIGFVRKWLVRAINGPMGGHRGGTHSYLAAAVVGALGWLIYPWLGVAMGLGWLAHIAGDRLTDKPVHVYWPFTRRKQRSLGLVTTGSRGEDRFRFQQRLVLAALVLVLIVTRALPDLTVEDVRQLAEGALS